MTTVVEFQLIADPNSWRSAGFFVDPTDTMLFGGIRLRCIAPNKGAATAIISWTLADAPDTALSAIDGLITTHADAPDLSQAAVTHPNGVTGIDHLVIYTPNLEVTCAAIAAATDAPLKRIREVGPLRQGFHRLGELIIEVVSFPEVAVQSATFWGLALNAVDLDAMFDAYGDNVMSTPKNAVQPGRQISSFREGAGLGLPVAVMTVPSR